MLPPHRDALVRAPGPNIGEAGRFTLTIPTWPILLPLVVYGLSITCEPR